MDQFYSPGVFQSFRSDWTITGDQVQACVLDHQGKVLVNHLENNQVHSIHATAERYGEVTAVAIEACCGVAIANR